MSVPPNANAVNVMFEFGALAEAQGYRGAVVREFAPKLNGSVVEIGAGVGQMTKLLRALPGVQRLIAVEPDESFAIKLRREHPGLEVIHGTISQLPASVTPDVVVSVNVLEHIECDEAELRRYCDLVRPVHGIVCLFVPARPELYAPLDRDFGHFRRYTRTELCRKLGTAGFEIIRVTYFNLAGYFGWWMVFKMLKRRGISAGLTRFFDRVVFPVTNWTETRLCRPPIGQSLIAIARPGSRPGNEWTGACPLR